jgi:hypothetical protein
MPSPDPFAFGAHDKEYLQLIDYTRRIRKASQDPKKMDAAWEVYKKIRDECYQLCKSLLNKSRECRTDPSPLLKHEFYYRSWF